MASFNSENLVLYRQCILPPEEEGSFVDPALFVKKKPPGLVLHHTTPQKREFRVTELGAKFLGVPRSLSHLFSQRLLSAKQLREDRAGVNQSVKIKASVTSDKGLFKPLSGVACGGAERGLPKESHMDREVAGYVIAQHFHMGYPEQDPLIGVPPTCKMACKMDDAPQEGSLQLYIRGAQNLHKIDDLQGKLNSLPKEVLQRLFFFDLLTCNTDRNRGNLMLKQTGQDLSLILVDHSLILPNDFACSAFFTWLHWNVSGLREPFSVAIVQMILETNYEILAEKILEEMPGFSIEALASLRYSLEALKLGVEADLTPHQLASLFVSTVPNLGSPMNLINTYDKAHFLDHLRGAVEIIRREPLQDAEVLSEKLSLHFYESVFRQVIFW